MPVRFRCRRCGQAAANPASFEVGVVGDPLLPVGALALRATTAGIEISPCILVLRALRNGLPQMAFTASRAPDIFRLPIA
ncbi:MAG: hypothetical protein N2C12_01585, partial [Planctomycetales bacterium]